MKKYGKLPYGKDVTISFGEDSLIEITPETETKVKYTRIENIVGGTFAIYIYISAVQAFVVPVSVFPSIQEQDEFWNFIHDKWNAAKLSSI